MTRRIGMGSAIKSSPHYEEILKLFTEMKREGSSIGQIWLAAQPLLPGCDRATFYRWAKEMTDKSKRISSVTEAATMQEIANISLLTQKDKIQLQRLAIQMGLAVLLDEEQKAGLKPKERLDIALRAATLHQAEQELMVGKIKHDDEISLLDKAIYGRETIEIIPLDEKLKSKDTNGQEEENNQEEEG